MKVIDLENNCWICFMPEFFRNTDFLQKVYGEVIKDLSQQEISFYGKEFLLPRLTAWYGDKEYKYSGTVNLPKPMPPCVLEIRKTLEEKFNHLPGMENPSVLNSVLCNYYRNGNDSINWHSDDESMLGPQDNNVLIASVTFGQERKFVLRNKDTKQKMNFMLGSGDVLFMGGKTQKHWKHKIPKTSKPQPPRLNLTFRNVKSEN